MHTGHMVMAWPGVGPLPRVHLQAWTATGTSMEWAHCNLQIIAGECSFQFQTRN